jgi:hypothetical protein
MERRKAAEEYGQAEVREEEEGGGRKRGARAEFREILISSVKSVFQTGRRQTPPEKSPPPTEISLFIHKMIF